jgi:UPF0755 protein
MTAFAHPAGVKDVLIPTGSGPRSVANALARAGVVSDADLFYAWLRREQLGPKLKAGEYEFTLPISPADAAQKLVAGQQKTYHVTVPEGLRVDETLPLLAASALKLRLEKLNALAADPAFVRKLVPQRIDWRASSTPTPTASPTGTPRRACWPRWSPAPWRS